MSRIIAGKLRLDVDMVDMNEVIAAAIDVIRPPATLKGVEVRFRPDPEVSSVQGDAGRLQQVLWNLLTNAIKFTPKGGRVEVTLRSHRSAVEVEVRDTGKGIAPAFLARVFDRFSQEDGSNARSVGGLGLGLAIVKHLVELHGGVVSVQSEGEGCGASFVMRLPVVSVRRTYVESRATTPPVEDISFPAELEGLHIVVLDDERDARELIQMVLERGGARVTTVSSVQEALESVARHKPSVIISDIGMPEEDGYAFIRQLRALPHEEGGRIPAVALTAYARAEDRRRALSAGFQNHAAKPIEPQELVLVVANLAGRYS
jgi:CheY-like chemotaxis protein/two-component sensor histidine kinase